MELKEYQARALETAKPTALNEAYLAPMIVREIGEVFGKVAKATRDEWETERFNAEMLKEVGDVCWGVAVYAHVLGVDLAEENAISYPAETLGDALDELLGEAHIMRRDLAEVPLALAVIWADIEENAELLTGHTFDQILEANLAKLADRKNRGVIAGSGDNR